MKNKLISLFIILSIFSLVNITYANDLNIHFIDVGQGDAILAELPNQETMLIDAGNNDSGSTVARYLHTLKIDHIDYLLGTHPHADHIGGLDYIIQNFRIEQIFMPNVSHTTQTFRDVLEAVKNKNKKITSAEAGLNILNEYNLNISLLNPLYSTYDNLNSYSLVTKIEYKNTSFIFTGDIEKKAEYDLINSNTALKADLLQIPHHGSSSSASNLFLRTVNPKYGVISVGSDNPFGHPSSRIIKRLSYHGIDIYRTDKQGTITATSNGEEISFNTHALATSKEDKTTSHQKVKISYLSLSDEVVEITNTSEQDINLSDWQLVSVQGNQTFTFPTGTVLAPGGSLKILSGPGQEAGYNEIIWTGRYIWNNNGDKAKLYNQQQELISSY